MKKILFSFALLLGLTVGGGFLFGQQTVLAQGAKDQICSGVGAVSGGSGCTAAAGEPTLDEVIDVVIDIFSTVVGIIAVIMIIVGGFRYVTSGGDSSKTGSAKTTIIYALVGIVIVALAQTLVKFVLARV